MRKRRSSSSARPKKRGHATKKAAIKAGKAGIRALDEHLASTYGIVPQWAWDAISRGGNVPADASRMYDLARKSPQGVDLTRSRGVIRNPSPVRGLRRASPSKRHPTRAGQGMPWPWLDRTTGGLLYVRRGLRRLRPYRPSAKRRNPLLQVVTPNGRRRARRKNPLLQVVTPNPVIRGYAGRGGSRVRGGQRLSGVRFVSPSEARTYPGFAKALATFKAFHGRAPTHFTRVRLEDGDEHVSRRAVVMVGEAPAIEYRTWRYANSTKSHTKDGRRITWRHKMGELGGKPAYYVHDPVSGVTSLLGGTYRVAGRPAFYHH